MIAWDIAAAVAQLLQDAPLSVPATVRLDYQAEYELPELASLRITVSPARVNESIVARGRTALEYETHVTLQQARGEEDAPDDRLVALMWDEILPLLRFVDLETTPAAQWVGMTSAVVADRRQYLQERVFAHRVTVRHRTIA